MKSLTDFKSTITKKLIEEMEALKEPFMKEIANVRMETHGIYRELERT